MTIKQGMILAAGKGERMRPLTNTCAKPMVPVNGKPIIDYALQQMADAKIERVIVNTHYMAEGLEAHLKTSNWPFEIIISREDALLDTGGGIKNALQYLDSQKPLMVLSGDSILLGENKLPQHWDDTRMDLLLLLQPLSKMVLTPGVGDYSLVNGTPKRALNQNGDYIWTSARILHPRLFENTPEGPFSFLSLMDRAEKENRLAAQIHDDIWHHLTTPDDVARVNNA